MAGSPLFLSELVPKNQSWASGLSLGLAGVSFAAVLSLVSASSLDCWLWWASIAFAIVIPFALCHSMLCRGWSDIPLATLAWRIITGTVGMISYLFTFAGIALMFRHVSLAHALSFAGAALGTCLLWFCQRALFHRIHRGRIVALPPNEQTKP